MTGSHRGTTQSTAASVGKSVTWLLQIAGLVAALLILLAAVVFVCCVAFTQPPKAWPFPIGVAFGITVCIFAIAYIAQYRMQRR